MAQPIIQPNFAAGELAASLWARVDLAKYHAGLALCRNFWINYQGGASNRSGTAFVGRCIDSTNPNRLIPFTFSTVQTYALVFGHLTMRVIMNGGWVLETAATVTGVSNANPGVITVANTLSNGDEVYVSGLQGSAGIQGLNGRNYKVANQNAAHITLVDLWGTPIDTTALGAWTAGGTVARVYTKTSPYAAADLALLKFTQSADTMTLTHPSYALYQLTRSGHAAWTFTASTFAPTVPAPGGAPTVTPSSAGTTTYNYVVTGLIKGLESEPSAAGTTALGATMSTVAGAHNTIDWTAHTVPNATAYKVYRNAEVPGGAPTAGALFGYVGMTTGTTFVDSNIAPDFTKTPPIGNNPFASANNPFCSTYFQQRQIYGGSVNNPAGLVLSQSGDYQNMDYSTPSRDSDEIELTLSSLQVNAIKHLIPLNSLIVLTASGAWRVDGGGIGVPITPTEVSAVPQAYNGSSDVPPQIVNYDILYVESKGSIVRDLSYNFYVNIYTGNDISVLSSHLFRGHQIVEWAWAQEPWKLMWCVRDDGKLITLTYLKEQDVFGWGRHDTQGLFKSTCSISEGQENAVYFIVLRYINGQYVQYVEHLASRNLGSDPIIGIPADWTLAWFVDCGLQYPLGYPAATLTPVAADLVQDPTFETYNGTTKITSVSVDFGGSGYTAPSITVVDRTGSGAVLTANLTGNVITSVTVNNGGNGYTNPTLTINDSTGSGAALSAAIQRSVHFNADSSVFTGADVGKILRFAGGIGTVTAQTGTQITVNLTQPINNIWPAAPNAWSLTTPTMTVTGLHHLEGQTVSVLADGNVMPAQIVTNGSITIPEACSSIVAGLSYRSQLKSLYLDIGEPTIQGKRKKLPAITLRVVDTRGLKAGPGFDQLEEFKQRTTQLMGQAIPSITGDMRVVMDPKWQTEGQVCVQQDDPLPATVLGFIPELTIGDT